MWNVDYVFYGDINFPYWYRKWFLMLNQSQYCTLKWPRKTFSLKEVSFPLFDWCFCFFFFSWQSGNYIILSIDEFYYICHGQGCRNAYLYVLGKEFVTCLFGICYFLMMVLIDDDDFISSSLVGNASKKMAISK